jgi:hypothetical protein
LNVIQFEYLKLTQRCTQPAWKLWHAWLVLVVVIAAGCAARSVTWNQAPDRGTAPSKGPVFVLQPIVLPNEPGNVGRDFGAIRTMVTDRILAIVKERFPNAQLAVNRPAPGIRYDLYSAAVGEPVVSVDEMNGAASARRAGATHLLVPTISEWKEMRTDDPVGAVILPHNSVTLSLRLMQLEPPALAGRLTFHNQARLTLNQAALGLLDAEFQRVILKLIAN